ncbi:hypothetical protein [uncultured Shewanella sp.]|uniref:hypothetical protein n=1 Tax=uncultured Shewanella sp. TaxID=173975 RepID=UPI0026144B0F|nr:hypothetical protein [uncultured Shewanella sp.]
MFKALNDTHPLCLHGLTEYLIYLLQTLKQTLKQHIDIGNMLFARYSASLEGGYASVL